ncbi:DUF1444 domain-containing protein [Chungangia koreensis]|uniref:DUF1444 domain-containing protein n=1 Tax=Chungangia koreensis TaxID=752657 RepID=A0ABV8X554_9LACT
MKSEQLVEQLKDRLPAGRFTFRFDKKNDSLRLEHKELRKGIDISLPPIIAKYETVKEKAIDEVVYTVSETFKAMEKEMTEGFGGSSIIYPVIRSTSFPLQSKEGHDFVVTDHTAETRIFYALDMGSTYRLVDQSMLEELHVTEASVREMARFSVRNLPTEVKKDEVSGNYFYFVNSNDGYDASRILNDQFLKDMYGQIEGDMTVSVPHQDVLIIGDIRNETGYDVLAQMTMHFFTVGLVPVTSLSFIYEDGKLEPIFILAKNRVKKEKDEQ